MNEQTGSVAFTASNLPDRGQDDVDHRMRTRRDTEGRSCSDPISGVISTSPRSIEQKGEKKRKGGGEKDVHRWSDVQRIRRRRDHLLVDLDEFLDQLDELVSIEILPEDINQHGTPHRHRRKRGKREGRKSRDIQAIEPAPLSVAYAPCSSLVGRERAWSPVWRSGRPSFLQRGCARRRSVSE